MQSLVTGQAPINLERKITPGGKQTKPEDNAQDNWNKSYTSDENIEVRSAYICTYQDAYYISYAQRVE